MTPALAEKGLITQPADEPKVYLPGDVVHIIVGAPPDTVRMVAEMPDGDQVNLGYEKRNFIWKGHWEVPMLMKKGTYQAKLTAVDVEGKTFTGETAPFIVGEPTLVTLIEMVEVKEGKKKSVMPRPAVVAPTETAEEKPTEEAVIEETAVEEAPALKAEVKEVKRAVQKLKPKKARSAKLKKTAFNKKQKEDKSAMKTKYIVAARYYMTKQDYAGAQAQLNSLYKMDPYDREVKRLLNRVNAVVKAEGVTR
jgi:hypothetical protein